MSDNVTPIFEQEPQKKTPIRRRWIFFLALTVLILALLIWFLLSNSTALDGIKRFFRYLGVDKEDYGSAQFESYGNCAYALVDDALAVSSQNGLTLFSEGGTAMNAISANLSNPILDSAGKRVLLYDLGGTRLISLSSGGELLFDLTVTGTIYDADLCNDGLCAVIYEGTDCYAILDVYNEKGAKIFSHRSQSAFLNTCALSEDGEYVVVTTLGQDDLSFQSSARILATDREEIRANFSFGSQVICDTAFFDDGTICSVGEDRLFFFTADGTLIREVHREQTLLSSFRFSSDNLLVLYDHYDLSLGYRLSCIDSGGTETASMELSDRPLYMSLSGHYICLTDSKNISIYDDEWNLRHRTENTSYIAALARDDGTAVCIGNGFAELYIP